MKKTIHVTILSLILALVFTQGIFAAPAPTGGIQVKDDGSQELTAEREGENVPIDIKVTYDQTNARFMLSQVNVFRQDGERNWYWNKDNTTKTTCSGLQELTYDYTLEKIAMKRAAEIAMSFSHVRPDGNFVFDEVHASTSYSSMGENIAAGQTDESEAFTAWEEADCDYDGQGHRRNMLSSDFNAIGIGCAIYNGRKYWVQVFGGGAANNSVATDPCNSESTVSVNVAASKLKRTIGFNGSGELTMEQGKTKDLSKATCSMGYGSYMVPVQTDITWSVEDSSIAKIENGVLTALKIGTTNVSASATIAGTGVTVKFPLTVTEVVVLPSYENTEYFFTTLSGDTVSSKAGNKPKMLIYCTDHCGSCDYLLSMIASDSASYSPYEILLVYMEKNSTKTLQEYASGVPNGPFTICQDDDFTAWDYQRLLNGQCIVATPLLVLINTDNRVIDFNNGVRYDLASWMEESFSKTYETGDKSDPDNKDNADNKDNKDNITDDKSKDDSSNDKIKDDDTKDQTGDSKESQASANVKKPGTVTIKNLKSPSAGKISLSWKKVKSAGGYQIQIATDSKFKKNKKSYNATGAKKTIKLSKAQKKKFCKKKTFCYARVRAYVKKNGKKTYSSWSNVKRVKVKK